MSFRDRSVRRIGSKTKGWKVGRSLFSYRDVFNGSNKEFPCEAEDLCADRLFTSFVKRKQDERLAGKTKRPKPEGGWHFDLAPAEQGAFCEFLATEATKDVRRCVQMYEKIRAAALPGQSAAVG